MPDTTVVGIDPEIVQRMFAYESSKRPHPSDVVLALQGVRKPGSTISVSVEDRSRSRGRGSSSMSGVVGHGPRRRSRSRSRLDQADRKGRLFSSVGSEESEEQPAFQDYRGRLNRNARIADGKVLINSSCKDRAAQVPTTADGVCSKAKTSSAVHVDAAAASSLTMVAERPPLTAPRQMEQLVPDLQQLQTKPAPALQAQAFQLPQLLEEPSREQPRQQPTERSQHDLQPQLLAPPPGLDMPPVLESLEGVLAVQIVQGAPLEDFHEDLQAIAVAICGRTDLQEGDELAGMKFTSELADCWQIEYELAPGDDAKLL